jgi:tetratricopeptide (TPR) repeat protein
MQNILRATIRELAYKIKSSKTPRFSFFLGAGASKQSGIPIASEMIRQFKEQIILQSCPAELKTDAEKNDWLAAEDWCRADGSDYCKYFEKFEPKEFGRQRHIEDMIKDREPSFGYVVLANLMASGHVNTIVTTNFDDLVYSACTTFTGIRPIVYAYGVLAAEMRFTAQRTKILKLHGDYLYSKLKNTNSELAEQDPNMARQLRQVLNEYGLIVVGYGGGDASVMKVLSDFPEENDLYWCIRRGDKPNEAVEKLLREKRGFLVEIEGFDEMMNEIRPIVEFDVKKMIGSIEERRNKIIEQLEKFDPQYSTDILGEIVNAAKEPATNINEDKKIKALDFFVRANEAYDAKELSQAEALYRKAIEIDSKYHFAYNNLGNVLADLKRYDEAEAAYRKVIEIDPNNVIAYNNLGDTLSDSKRYDEAEAACRKAIELDPNYALAYANLGNLLRNLKRYDEAEVACRKAIELDPNNVIAYNNLGNVFLYLKRYDEAEAAYRKGIEIDPKDVITHTNLGGVLTHSKRYDEAEAACRKAIELDPNNVIAYNNLGNLLRNLKRYDEAEATYRKGIEIDPNWSSSYNSLSLLLRLINRDPEALSLAEKAQLLDPSSSHHLLALASIHKKLGHQPESNQYIAQARELFEPDDWYNLACVESVSGDTDVAIENLRRVAQLPTFDREWARADPDLEWIRDDPRFKEIVGEDGARG